MCAAEALLPGCVSHIDNKRLHHKISELEDWLPECILKECPLETFAVQRTIIWYSLKQPTAEKDQKDTDFKTLLILTHFELYKASLFSSNRVHNGRSNLEITAWNAHPDEVMQKMKHIWQNEAVVRETRQCQRKGQQGHNQDSFLFVPPAFSSSHNPASCSKAGILSVHENKADPSWNGQRIPQEALWWPVSLV